MSVEAIRKALEAECKAVLPVDQIAWQNVNFEPKSAEEFYEVYVLFAEPENPTQGDGFYRQRGYLQITLQFPANKGPGPARTAADALRSHFHRGLPLEADGVTTIIERTPEIGSGSNDGDRFTIVMKARFWADIFGA